MHELPPELRSAVQDLVRGIGSLGHKTHQMTQHFRGGGSSDSAIDFNAYLVTRLPATYASVAACLDELIQRCPQFSPKTLLDVGAGPGTVGWAGVEYFPDIDEVTFFDNNRQFLELAGHLAEHSEHGGLRGAKTQNGDFCQAPPGTAADLVVASYAMAELPVSKVASATRNLWLSCKAMLMIIEPGTPQGYARILEARSVLIKEGAHIVAPCSHQKPCPLISPDWCHFKARLMRSREHMHAKNATVPFEDEKFSYLIVSRSSAEAIGARILAPPIATKVETRFKLCSENGVSKLSVPTRDKTEYKRVRKLHWGDIF